jgi:hypothetical protein
VSSSTADALSGLADQFAEDGARRRHGLDHEVPLGGIRQRHVETRLQPFDAVERQAAAITQQGEQARTTGVIFRRADALGQRRGEGRVAQTAAQLLQLVDRGAHRRLSDDLDDDPGRRVIDLAWSRPGRDRRPSGRKRLHFDDRGVAILRGAVAAVAFLRRWLRRGDSRWTATPLPPGPRRQPPDASIAADGSSDWAAGGRILCLLSVGAPNNILRKRVSESWRSAGPA